MNSITLHTKALVKTLIAKAEDGVQMTEVFLVACGGSLVDLYPAKFFLASESCLLRSDLYTANEFVHAAPKVLGERSVVILCSHSGDTPEMVEAVKVAKAAGSLTVTLTHNKSSHIADFSDHNIVYEWAHCWLTLRRSGKTSTRWPCTGRRRLTCLTREPWPGPKNYSVSPKTCP